MVRSRCVAVGLSLQIASDHACTSEDTARLSKGCRRRKPSQFRTCQVSCKPFSQFLIGQVTHRDVQVFLTLPGDCCAGGILVDQW